LKSLTFGLKDLLEIQSYSSFSYAPSSYLSNPLTPPTYLSYVAFHQVNQVGSCSTLLSGVSTCFISLCNLLSYLALSTVLDCLVELTMILSLLVEFSMLLGLLGEFSTCLCSTPELCAIINNVHFFFNIFCEVDRLFLFYFQIYNLWQNVWTYHK